MEIGNHRIHNLKAITGYDKQTCSSMIRLDTTIVEVGNALQHTHGSCANCHDTSTSTTRLIDQLGSWSIQVNLFAVHLMVAYILTLDRPESIKPHMQCHKANPHSLAA